MNTEKQRIAIAEACGWKHIKHTNQEDVDIESRSITYWSGLTGVPPKFIHDQNRIIIPDYLNNLNAMHEAEKVLDEEAFGEYRHHLIDKLKTSWGVATSAQRAEAFLRTIGKWEDDK